MTHVYLDYNATAPVRPAAVAAVGEALALLGNPSSIHGPGQRARGAVEQARTEVAGVMGCQPGEIVFTSGGTEANNLAMTSLGVASIIASGIEHDSILAPAKASGLPFYQLAAGRDGLIDLDALAAALVAAPAPALVAVMAANNETGAIQPVAQVVLAARAAGARVHCDAIQAVGKIPVAFATLGVDSLALSAHKFGGPKGAGALIVRDGFQFNLWPRGGGQEFGRRAGTENIPGIMGLSAALQSSVDELSEVPAMARMRDDLERRLIEAAPAATIISGTAPRLPNTTCVALPGVAAATLVMALDLAGIAVSAGSACSSGKVRASHVLTAMGFGPDLAGSAIRVSLGWASTAGDVERFLAAWRDIQDRFRRPSAAVA
jgi:cysteine desulfurase